MPLTRRQKAVLPFLVSGMSIQEAARQSGVSDETLRRWMSQPEFCDLLDAGLNQAFQDAIGKAAGADIAELLPQAIGKIREILNDPKSRPRTKLMAAKTIWDIGLRLRSLKEKTYDRD